MFQKERAKIPYLIFHLTDQIEAWATTEWARRSPFFESYFCFSEFSSGQEVACSLISLCQGHKEFCMLAVNRGWNNSALTDAFLSSFSHEIKDQFVSFDLSEELGSNLYF